MQAGQRSCTASLQIVSEAPDPVRPTGKASWAITEAAAAATEPLLGSTAWVLSMNSCRQLSELCKLAWRLLPASLKQALDFLAGSCGRDATGMAHNLQS